MIFHHHCEICGAEAYRGVHLRTLYVGFGGSLITTYYLCGYHSRQLEDAMYCMKKAKTNGE